MCPVCIGSAVAYWAGGGSVGAAALWISQMLGRNPGAPSGAAISESSGSLDKTSHEPDTEVNVVASEARFR